MDQSAGGGSFLRKGLKLSHLRLMAALQATGQLGLAAERLGIAQPAASRLLAEVERITGTTVHERTGRGIQLTEAGAVLARRATRVMMELRDAEAEVAGVGRGLRGHVRIGSVTGPAMDRVIPALRAARVALPEVTAEVTVAPSDILGEQLLSGRLDFILGRLPERSDPALLDMQLLDTEPVDLMVRRGHRLAGATGLSVMDLLEFDWVMPGQDTILGRAVMARLAELGMPMPARRLSTASFLLMLAMVQQSNAIAPIARAVADVFARAQDAPYALVPIDLGIEVEPFGLITRAGAELPPAARRLADLAIAAVPPRIPLAGKGNPKGA